MCLPIGRLVHHSNSVYWKAISFRRDSSIEEIVQVCEFQVFRWISSVQVFLFLTFFLIYINCEIKSSSVCLQGEHLNSFFWLVWVILGLYKNSIELNKNLIELNKNFIEFNRTQKSSKELNRAQYNSKELNRTQKSSIELNKNSTRT